MQESANGPSRSCRLSAFVSAIDAVDGSSTRHVSAMDVGAVKRSHDSEELPMQAVTTIGLDSPSRYFTCTALMPVAKWSSAAS
jgi:hypothetical protein